MLKLITKFILIVAVVAMAGNILPKNKDNLRGTCFYISRVDLSSSEILKKIVVDSELQVSSRICGVEQISSIYVNNTDKNEPNAAGLLKAIMDGYEMHKAPDMNKVQSESNENSRYRSSVCGALGSFATTAVFDEAMNSAARIIETDPDPDVAIACITMMSYAKGSREKLSVTIIQRIESILEEKVINDDRVRLMNALVSTLGKLANKDGYIALVKVLQSAYPRNVKDASERAIHQLEMSK